MASEVINPGGDVEKLSSESLSIVFGRTINLAKPSSVGPGIIVAFFVFIVCWKLLTKKKIMPTTSQNFKKSKSQNRPHPKGVRRFTHSNSLGSLRLNWQENAVHDLEGSWYVFFSFFVFLKFVDVLQKCCSKFSKNVLNVEKFSRFKKKNW